MHNILQRLQQGQPVLVVDDTDRENEGDLVLPAQYANAQQLNQLDQLARGMMCLAMTTNQLDQIQVPLMVTNNHSAYQTPFCVTIEAARGVTTGVSMPDRAATIAAAIHSQAKPQDLVRPGHIQPLRAHPQGVLKRRGHTEGSVDLMQLAGLNPSAVIAEVMAPDGTMLKGQDLNQFAQEHDIPLVSIQAIVDYRLQHENHITLASSANLPIAGHGPFALSIYHNAIDNDEIMVLQRPYEGNPLVRVHSSCTTGDILGSSRCDCGPQLEASLQYIDQQGGILIYLNQEGRGIGLTNKIKAYALQEQGYDTVEANQLLGRPNDQRTYWPAAHILRDLNIDTIELLTNNPHKVTNLQHYGINISKRHDLHMPLNSHNEYYLQTKRDKMNHWLPQN